ncbi:hypothetical protein ABZY16_25110 [Streptomyces sp. NPDC006553]|uniref:hypothetical protein n=1 Tax=unclassified Streptomyces TaxID=2593676 RepID=UPI0022533717|nr:hypothetical protein [Streptomyces sp. NBC_00233]MCX5231378.1 hypothetical protein [Streptomyces sp. NBC_00233]
MALTTVVSMTVSDNALDEARRALSGLAGSAIGPVESPIPQAGRPGARTKLVLSLAGDVREQVDEQLAAVPVLAYEVKVVPREQ